MQDGAHAGIACRAERRRIGADRHRQRQQLIGRVEIGPLQPRDILRIARTGSRPSRIGVDGANAGLLETANTRVAVLGRVADLRDVDDRGRAHVDHGERCDQFADMNVGRRIGECEVVLDVAIVVGLDEAVGERAPEQALVGMDVRVHETGDDDPVDAIDDDRIGRRGDVGADGADLSVFDQDVGRGEGAGLAIQRQHDAARQPNAAGALQGRKLGVAVLPRRRAGEERDKRSRRGKGCARLEECPSRGSSLAFAGHHRLPFCPCAITVARGCRCRAP